MKSKVIHYHQPKFQNSQELKRVLNTSFLLIGNVFTLFSQTKTNLISILPFIVYFFRNKIINNSNLVSLVRKKPAYKNHNISQIFLAFSCYSYERFSMKLAM